MADLALPAVPSTWAWKSELNQTQYTGPNLERTKNIKTGSRYGLTLFYNNQLGATLKLLQSRIRRSYFQDRLLVRWEEDLRCARQTGAMTVRANTLTGATQIPVTVTQTVMAGTYIQAGDGVYETLNTVTPGTRTVNVMWAVRTALSAGTVLGVNPVFKMKGDGNAPDFAHNGKQLVSDHLYGPVNCTVWEAIA